jgi:hypothetical protein
MRACMRRSRLGRRKRAFYVQHAAARAVSAALLIAARLSCLILCSPRNCSSTCPCPCPCPCNAHARAPCSCPCNAVGRQVRSRSGMRGERLLGAPPARLGASSGVLRGRAQGARSLQAALMARGTRTARLTHTPHHLRRIATVKVPRLHVLSRGAARYYPEMCGCSVGRRQPCGSVGPPRLLLSAHRQRE